MRGKYELYYDTIGSMLKQIAEGQGKHSFAIIPEAIYADWKRLADFQSEEEHDIADKDNTRKYSTAHFADAEHSWQVITTKCKHPDPAMGNDWRFIKCIIMDDSEISHSQMSIEDFFKICRT